MGLEDVLPVLALSYNIKCCYIHELVVPSNERTFVVSYFKSIVFFRIQYIKYQRTEKTVLCIVTCQVGILRSIKERRIFRRCGGPTLAVCPNITVDACCRSKRSCVVMENHPHRINAWIVFQLYRHDKLPVLYGAFQKNITRIGKHGLVCSSFVRISTKAAGIEDLFFFHTGSLFNCLLVIMFAVCCKNLSNQRSGKKHRYAKHH